MHDQNKTSKHKWKVASLGLIFKQMKYHASQLMRCLLHFLFQVVSGIKYVITANIARTSCRKTEAQELCEIPAQGQVMTVWRGHGMTGTSWGPWCIQMMIVWSERLNMLKPLRSFYWPFPVHLNVNSFLFSRPAVPVHVHRVEQAMGEQSPTVGGEVSYFK